MEARDFYNKRISEDPMIGSVELMEDYAEQFRDEAKRYKDELIRDRETFMTILAHGVENEKIELLIKSKIIMIDNVLKK